jgi:hypothetical protein
MNHLRAVNMSYFGHLLFALQMAAALVIHGLFPCVLETYVSDRLCHRDEPADSEDFSPFNTTNS